MAGVKYVIIRYMIGTNCACSTHRVSETTLHKSVTGEPKRKRLYEKALNFKTYRWGQSGVRRVGSSVRILCT